MFMNKEEGRLFSINLDHQNFDNQDSWKKVFLGPDSYTFEKFQMIFDR